MTTPEAQRRRERIQLVLTWVNITISLVTLIFVLVVVNPTADDSHDALCALRVDRVAEIAQGEQFLKQHPDGAFGFSKQDIEANLDQLRQTVETLSFLDCG